MSQPAQVTTTYLEMLSRPAGTPRAVPEGASVARSEEPTAAFYRFLYRGVGGPWQWQDRSKIDDTVLLELLSRSEVFVLYHRGTPAGYAELNFGQPEQTKLEYFGLFTEFIGRGLGGWFLEWIVREAWRDATRRVWVHTCTLDHPNALPVYLKAGFGIYNRITAPNPYL